MTWDEIKKIDRQLDTFDRELSRFKDSCSEEADWRLYEVFKKWGSEHVGWDARIPNLRTEIAYDAMIRHVTAVLGL